MTTQVVLGKEKVCLHWKVLVVASRHSGAGVGTCRWHFSQGKGSSGDGGVASPLFLSLIGTLVPYAVSRW